MTSEKTAEIEEIELLNGRIIRHCYIDPESGAPAGFIGLSDGRGMYEFVNIKNICSFRVAEENLRDMWAMFDAVPESVVCIRSCA